MNWKSKSNRAKDDSGLHTCVPSRWHSIIIIVPVVMRIKWVHLSTWEWHHLGLIETCCNHSDNPVTNEWKPTQSSVGFHSPLTPVVQHFQGHSCFHQCRHKPSPTIACLVSGAVWKIQIEKKEKKTRQGVYWHLHPLSAVNTEVSVGWIKLNRTSQTSSWPWPSGAHGEFALPLFFQCICFTYSPRSVHA